MTTNSEFHYEPDSGELLSTAVVAAIAEANNEEVLEQTWRISEDINPDALDGLFQRQKIGMTLTFEADEATVTITANQHGNPVIKVKSHR